MAAAVEVWEQVLQVAPERAYLTFDRLAAAYPHPGSARSVRAPLPADHREEPAGLAGAAGARRVI